MVTLINAYLPSPIFKLLLLLAFSTITYLLLLLLSLILYHLHTPNLIFYYLHQSFPTIFTRYAYLLVVWILLALIYFYLKFGGYDVPQQSSSVIAISSSQAQSDNMMMTILRGRKTMICIIMTIIFIHSFVLIQKTETRLNTIYNKFRQGKSGSTWPGWRYYLSDSYYEQTKQRLQKSRARFVRLEQYENMLMCLKDLQGGIYSIRSWQSNHKLLYRLIAIGYKTIGIFFLLIICFLFFLTSLCHKAYVYHCATSISFVSIWLCIPIFVLFSQALHSIIAMNNHELCLQLPNSGFFSIIINNSSASLIKDLNFSLVEDPNNIYGNVCQTMKQFYEGPLQEDQNIVKYVFILTALWFTFSLSSEILALIVLNKYKDAKILRVQQNGNKYEVVRNLQ